MKRLLAVFTLCATALIAASALSSPAAADGRHDGRRHAGPSDRQTSSYFTDRDRRHQKFRRHDKRHRHAYGSRSRHRHAYGYGHRHAYGYRHRHDYGPPRRRYGHRTSAADAHRFDGARNNFRFD